MLRATTTLRCFLCFALMELLGPVLLSAQDDKLISAGTQLTTTRAWADNLLNTPPTPSNFSSAPSYGRDGNGSPSFADTLTFQFDRGGTSAWLAETYLAAPPAFTSLQGREWSNGLAAGGTWFLTQSNTAAAHFMMNLDSSTTNVGGLPFEQYDGSYLTLRWGVSRLFLSGTGRNDLQIDIAGYNERMVAPPHLPIAFYMQDPASYAASSFGTEVTFSLPSRNSALSIRYGSERIVQQPTHSRLLQFQLSWSW